MNYNKLKITAESKNYMIKDLAAELGMTPNGLKRSVEANNLTMEKVAMLCKILDISPNEFFDWNGIGSHFTIIKEQPINNKYDSNSDLGCLMNILSRFLMNQEQQQEIMKDMVSIYKRINNK